jgi:short-subunit dehydrogenase
MAQHESSLVVLITGASSGIGLECAEYLASRGHHVYGTSRRPYPANDRFKMMQLELNNEAQIVQTVDEIVNAESRLDVLVNNAGYGIAGAIEDTSSEEVRALFDSNVIGPMRLCSAVLPHMRKQGSGLIVNVSSIAGLVPVPFQAVYSASKAALESLSEALRMEVRPFGIRVALLEPGDFCTGFTANRRRVAAAANSAYTDRFERALAVFERDERQAAPPAAIARQLERIMHSRAPRLRHRVANTLQRAAPTLRHILPHALYERLLMQVYDIHR